MKYSDQTLVNFTKPPSDAEETKLANAEKLVREAIFGDPILKEKEIRVFGQGSYANDTNVRLNSDIDINVMLDEVFFFALPKGKDRSEFGLNSPSKYTFSEFKNRIETALVNKFGANSVKRNDKCITIKASPTRVETDVVPTFKYRYYFESGYYVEGVEFKTDTGLYVVNYPLQHMENGKRKNSETQRRFKRLTRIFRRIRYNMIDERISVSDNITSFLLECLVWNVPNNILNNDELWSDRLRQAIIHLWAGTKEDNDCKHWGEVSEQLYLFHSHRKWTRSDVNSYLVQLWNYLGFK